MKNATKDSHPFENHSKIIINKLFYFVCLDPINFITVLLGLQS